MGFARTHNPSVSGSSPGCPTFLKSSGQETLTRGIHAKPSPKREFSAHFTQIMGTNRNSSPFKCFEESMLLAEKDFQEKTIL